MAYATLFSRIQMLEYIAQLPCVILEIKKLQAEAFRENVDIILRGTPSLPVEELMKKTEAMTLTIGDFLQTDEFVSVAPDVLEIMRSLVCFNGKTPKMVEEKPEILEETEANLMLYLEIKSVRNIRRNTAVHVDQNPYREMVWKLFRASRKLKEAMAFFYEVGMEIRILYQDLRFLLTFVDNSSSRYNDHELMKPIIDVINGVGDVEYFMMDNKIDTVVTDFISRISRIPVDLSVDKSPLETVVKDMFDRENGVRETLWEALKSVHYIRGKIENIFGETLDLKYFQSRSISLAVTLKSHNSAQEGIVTKSHNSAQEDIVIGLDADITEITKRLTRSPPFGREILKIVGMGGIGKTTLARKVFDDPSVVHHFHCRAWVTVSQLYHVKELLFRLLSSVSLPTCKIHDKCTEDIAEDLYRSLKGMRYLIVMDDVWSAEPWDAIQRYLPDDNNGSRILLTTRSAHVASQNSHFMIPLENNQSWKLLERVVFGKEICPPELMEVGKKIARKCRGLPLAIVVIGGLLSRILRTHDCWKDIETNVSSLVCSADPEECLEILALSYNHLPHHLKACFIYLGAFPEDCDIEVRKLITMWIAEGFLVLKSSKDLEKVAENCLEDLVGRNLVLVGSRSCGGKIKTCRLHDFLRELCLREAQKEDFMRVIKRSGQSFLKGPRSQHRLSFHVDPYDDVPVAPSIPQLLSFMCFTLGLGIKPDILFFELGFKKLRVLDIYFLHFDYFPSDILNLVHLRYLALNITYELPTSISKLKNLQTFLIHGPWPCRDSEESPTLLFEYWSMPSLRHLHSSIPSCLKQPFALSEDHPFPFAPRHLQTLSTLTFASCRKEVFTIMPHLKKIGICETKEDYMMDRSSKCLDSLACLHELEILKCSFYRETRETGEARTLYWVAFQSNLRHLTLSGSYLSWEDMVLLTELPHLEVLKLKYYAFQGRRWELTEEVFHCLKLLLIDKSDLVHWETSSTDHFPQLQHLILRSCESLNAIPSDVGELPTLSRIELDHCSTSAENSAREFQEQIESLDVVIRSAW